jgi:hypothetical protein
VPLIKPAVPAAIRTTALIAASEEYQTVNSRVGGKIWRECLTSLDKDGYLLEPNHGAMIDDGRPGSKT